MMQAGNRCKTGHSPISPSNPRPDAERITGVTCGSVRKASPAGSHPQPMRPIRAALSPIFQRSTPIKQVRHVIHPARKKPEATPRNDAALLPESVYEVRAPAGVVARWAGGNPLEAARATVRRVSETRERLFRRYARNARHGQNARPVGPCGLASACEAIPWNRPGEESRHQSVSMPLSNSRAAAAVLPRWRVSPHPSLQCRPGCFGARQAGVRSAASSVSGC